MDLAPRLASQHQPQISTSTPIPPLAKVLLVRILDRFEDRAREYFSDVRLRKTPKGLGESFSNRNHHVDPDQLVLLISVGKPIKADTVSPMTRLNFLVDDLNKELGEHSMRARPRSWNLSHQL